MKIYNYNPYQRRARRGRGGEGWGGVGLKSLNPSLPHHLCEAGKIRAWRSGEGQGKIAIPSIHYTMRYVFYVVSLSSLLTIYFFIKN